MVDTIRLLINVADPMQLNGEGFAPVSIEQLMRSSRYGKTYLNPPLVYAKCGKYMPRLTLHKRPKQPYRLTVEFSAPKMLYGNNFDELVDSDFGLLVKTLQVRLRELLGYRISEEQIAEAEVSAWHPSKNIVFSNYTACQTVISTVSKLDISRIYDLQKTDFRDGHVLHIHSSSVDTALYDKLADLRKASHSDKRAFEADNRIQLHLLKIFGQKAPFEVLRYEIRINGRKAIKRTFPGQQSWTFGEMFSERICQELLIKHWQKLTASVDLLALDTKQPYELLQNYLNDNLNATPQTALATVAAQLVINQVGVTSLRNTLEARYGTHTWQRIKPLLRQPQFQRYTYFKHIDEALNHITPTRLGSLLATIA